MGFVLDRLALGKVLFSKHLDFHLSALLLVRSMRTDTLEVCSPHMFNIHLCISHKTRGHILNPRAKGGERIT
jgi:hypothetical protein